MPRALVVCVGLVVLAAALPVSAAAVIPSVAGSEHTMAVKEKMSAKGYKQQYSWLADMAFDGDDFSVESGVLSGSYTQAGGKIGFTISDPVMAGFLEGWMEDEGFDGVVDEVASCVAVGTINSKGLLKVALKCTAYITIPDEDVDNQKITYTCKLTNKLPRGLIAALYVPAEDPLEIAPLAMLPAGEMPGGAIIKGGGSTLELTNRSYGGSLVISGMDFAGKTVTAVSGEYFMGSGALTVIPEPCTLAMMSLLGIGLLLRRRAA